MKVFNNEITIHRGETFSMDKVVQNKDGSPYIVSNKLSNPSILISVSTTRYDQTDRYVLNKWLRLTNKLFNSTEPFDLMSLMTEANGTTLKYPNGFTDITERKYAEDNSGNPLLDENGNKIGWYIVEGWLETQHVYYDYDDCVFYVEDEEGVRDYRYWISTTDTKGSWSKYEFRITCPFTQDETSQWIEQSYVYSISLVSGEWNNTPAENEPQYTSFNSVQPILTPTKLSVLSSINGGF